MGCDSIVVGHRNLSWQKFGRLFVKEFAYSKNNRGYWVCECECGNFKTVCDSELLRGNVKSCGCYRKDRLTVHGHNRLDSGPSPTHNSWRGMRERCDDPNNINYPRYGALGVTVFPQWALFENFLSDMGERPAGKTLDRINPFGNYEPSNCRWTTYKEQSANKRANYDPCA